MELSIKIFTPNPPSMEKNHFFYVFIMLSMTKFGENFEEKIDICFF